MTDRNLSIKVALGAVNNLTQPFNAAQKSTAALGRQIKATRDNLRDLPKQAASFDKLAESSNKAAARIEKLRRASDAVKSLDNPTQKQIAAVQKWDSRLGKLQEKQTVEVRRLAELRASLYQHGVSVASNSTATEQITQRTAQYNRQLQLQEQRLKRVVAARASYDRGQELRGKLQSGGMTALATGAVMAAPVALALRSYTGMEDAMKGVRNRLMACAMITASAPRNSMKCKTPLKTPQNWPLCRVGLLTSPLWWKAVRAWAWQPRGPTGRNRKKNC